MEANNNNSNSWFKKSIYVINDIIYVFFKKSKDWEPDTKGLSIYLNRSKTRGSVTGQVLIPKVISYEDFYKIMGDVFKSNTVDKMLKEIG